MTRLLLVLALPLAACASGAQTRPAPEAPTPEAAAPEACDDPQPLTLAWTPEQVRCALASGADPNARDDEGWAPLHTAINNGNAESIRLLVEAGAEIDITGPHDRPTLHHAVIYAGADAATLRLLVDLGADLAAADDDGDTALHAAARFDAPEAARALLASGADPNALSDDEQTPLHAAFLGSVEASVVPVLLEYGADPARLNTYGQTPLDIALESADSEYTDFDAAIEALRAAL